MESCESRKFIGRTITKKSELDNVKIKLVNFGYAFRIVDTIYLNESLLNHPALLDEAVVHELSHTNNFGMIDIIEDCRPGLPCLSKWKFFFSNKSAWWNFHPIFRIDGKWRWDITLILLYLTILLSLSGIIIYSIKILIILKGLMI